MKNQMRVFNEWVFILRRPAKARSGRIIIKIENVDAPDRPFVRALALLAEVWLNAKRQGGRHES